MSIRDRMQTLHQQSDAVTAPHCVVTLLGCYCSTCMAGRMIMSYQYKEDGVLRCDALPQITIGAAVIDGLSGEPEPVS